VTYYEIEGGSWRLPYRFFQDLEPHIAMNRRMTHIEYHDLAKGKSPRHVSDRSGERVSIRCLSETQTGIDGYTYQEEVFRGDVALITIPFSSLRHVTVSPMFSYKKRRAIIELHYDAATKVLLEFSRRWWEFKNVDEWTEALKQLKSKIGEKAYQEQEELWKERDPRTDKGEFIISDYVGGGNITDNPNRFAYVPSHPVAPGNQGGVMLASYSWSDDARRWDSMADHERSQMALKGIVEIHGWQCAMFFTGVAITQSWMHSPYAFGEAAVYTPGQMTSFHLEIPKNEGPVYFAGEHVSLKHAWIEGCLETATRMALDINKLPHS
jgi:monoamine oxidase